MKVDPENAPHGAGVCGCIVCMCDDFHYWLEERKEKRRAYKKAWAETPMHERFDLGGEG